MLAGTNRKISLLHEALASAERKPAPRISQQDLIEAWHNGTLHQRRAILRRYLHGVEVRPPIKANVFNTSPLVPLRPDPRAVADRL
ncbi:hypothetical protein [Streptomyces sp. RKAG337]|uniref:hypothetical protein n=1 Tax=Streptomyces sp. RKAG337 TaxID=2893404 RepID=UPI0020337C7C|nr:hypothetical protein [Streptomyces sp. RKAG337]MCM2430101.1 hypothetical protein [Streptomyces sp. RKAG337]